MNELALFAGGGGGVLGGVLSGWRTVAAVEIEEYPRAVLLQRQADGILPRFPVWDDVRTFDGRPWRGLVDVVSGGFPCQDISAAGKGAGIDGERSGLWGEMARIIGEVRPEYTFVENSPMLVGRGLARVLGDLAKMGYDARWCCMGAFAAGSCVNGERMWLVGATPDRFNLDRLSASAEKFDPAASSKRQFDRAMGSAIRDEDHAKLYRDTHELARGMERFKVVGNGQNPVLARLAWEMLR